MRHEAYQYEFPLHQGEFGFLRGPQAAGLVGVVGAFAWWAALRIEIAGLSPLPFHAAFRACLPAMAAMEKRGAFCVLGVLRFGA